MTQRSSSLVSLLVAVFSVGCLAWLPGLTNGDTQYSASLKIMSNYVYRGYSKSRGHPAIQGNIDYEHRSGFFIGSWMSQVDFGDENFNDRAHIEANPYAGVSLGLFENWRIDAALAGYLYDGKVYDRTADYGEVFALLHFRDLVTARWEVSYDAYNRGRSIVDYAVDMRLPLTDTVEVSGGVGYEDANAVLGYESIYWNIGTTWFLHKHASVDLHYHNAHRFGTQKYEVASFKLPTIGNHFVFSISIGF
jgi:uncharacterized protein (TIGR02001 family)